MAQELELNRITMEGQMTAEKNLSWGDILRTRGVRVIVWGSIFDQECQKILGCTTHSLYQIIINSKEPATRNGQSGYNIDCANIIAASVAEGSASQMMIEYD
ncbi:hypothetical protein MW887_000369 [Aspergillus wentii]|nr:hypothetical protein MW887_000369 [Aspergillus wentii]